MRDVSLREERDKAIYDTYLEGLKYNHFDSMQEAAEWVRQQPAPKFYMSSKSLVNYLGKLFSGQHLTGVNDNTREKVKELYFRYCQFLAEHPDSRYSRDYICNILVESPAPQFYLEWEYILLIIYKEKNKKQNEIRERYKR